jgi:hypothetical protein
LGYDIFSAKDNSDAHANSTISYILQWQPKQRKDIKKFENKKQKTEHFTLLSSI